MNLDRPLANPKQTDDSTLIRVNADCQKYKTVAKILETEKTLCALLYQLIGKPPLESILAIEHHPFLMNKFLRNNCDHFAELGKALDATSEDKILVYMTELYLYGVFHLHEYVSLINNLYENVDNPIASYTPKQITLSGFPQRVVFMCNSDKAIKEQLVTYCELHFKSRVQVNTTGNTADIILQSRDVPNLDAAKKMYEKFVEYVNEREGVAYFGLRQNIESKNGYEFVTSSMGDRSSIDTPEKLLRFLNGHPGPITINFNGNVQNVFVGNDNSINFIKEKRKDTAKKWICDHLPKNKEIKTNYYKRYLAANEHPVSESTFSKIVPEITNCVSYRSHGIGYWKYK